MIYDDYDKIDAVRNSDLGWFQMSPALYKLKVLDKPEKRETSFFSVGSAVHCKVLEPALYDKGYVVTSAQRPSNKQQVRFVENFLSGADAGIEDIDFLKKDSFMIAYSTDKMSDAKMEQRAQEVYEAVKEYIDLKLEEDERTMLSEGQQEVVENCSLSVSQHKLANHILLDNSWAECLNEFTIEWEFKDMKCKSRLDRLIIDHNNKKIMLVDLKTTSKHLIDFPGEYKTFDYERELTFYSMAIAHYIFNERPDLKEYDPEFYIVAVETLPVHECEVFQISNEDIMQRGEKLKNLLDDLRWHYKNDKWKYKRSYYEGNQFEILD